MTAYLVTLEPSPRKGTALPLLRSVDLRERDVVLREDAPGYAGYEHAAHEGVELVWGEVGRGEGEAEGEAGDDCCAGGGEDGEDGITD